MEEKKGRRVIKFRAWDKEMKWMREVAAISFGSGRVQVRGKVEEHGHAGVTTLLDSEIVLMQFTGPHDKNGKEIFEGDVCSDEYENIYEIDFSEGQFRKVNHKSRTMNPMRGPVLEVIGNIYENPELLK